MSTDRRDGLPACPADRQAHASLRRTPFMLLVLHAIDGHIVTLLAVRHHRQLGFESG